jgi:hypothetical protein
MNSEVHIDSIERDKNTHQLIIEIFDRLLKFGNEPVNDFIFFSIYL